MLSNAVTLHLDGTASVQHDDAGAYTTAQGACSCPEMEELQAPCQHVLAAEIHRRAQALLHGGSRSQRQPPASADWDVQEAQSSLSLKVQLRFGEIILTMRGITDKEVDERLRKRLAFIRELEETYLQHQANKDDLPAQAAPAEDSGPLEQMVEDAIQKAMQAWAAAQTNGNGHAAESLPAEEPKSDTDRFNQRGDKWCKEHQVWMKLRRNEGGSWHSHWIAAENRWCRGE